MNEVTRDAYETLRVILACMKKDFLSALTEPATLIQCITLPVGYLLLLGLFVLSGSNAPTAVVFGERGEYAQAFYSAMSQAHSFRLLPLTAVEAKARYQQGTLASVVTIPADFDHLIAHGHPGHVQLQVNNLNQDLTDDVRRAIHLAETTFDAQMFPGRISIVVQESDAYRKETDYIPFLSLSILVISLMVTGLLLAGMSVAREWETGTIKELLLSPASNGAVLVGKMMGAFVMGIIPVGVVVTILIVVIGEPPAHPVLVVGVSLLTLLVFVAAGVLLGVVLKQRISVATVTRAISVPLFFLSGVFGPITYLTWQVQFLARLFPTHYAIVLEQFAFKDFLTNTLSVAGNLGLLCMFLVLFTSLAIQTVEHNAIT